MTDGQTEFSSLDRVCAPRSAVKMTATKNVTKTFSVKSLIIGDSKAVCKYWLIYLLTWTLNCIFYEANVRPIFLRPLTRLSALRAVDQLSSIRLVATNASVLSPSVILICVILMSGTLVSRDQINISIIVDHQLYVRYLDHCNASDNEQ